MGLQKKISDLDSANALSGSELFEVVQSGQSVKGVLSSIATFIRTGYVSLIGAETLTNKRITPRSYVRTYDAAVTPNIDTYDVFIQAGITGNITIADPSGTPTEGQIFDVYLYSAGGGNTISYGANYIQMGSALPTLTTAGKRISLRFQYIQTKWLNINNKVEL